MRRALRYCGYSALLALAAAGGACGESEHGLTVINHQSGSGGAGGVMLGTGGFVSGGVGGNLPAYRCATNAPVSPVVRRSVADLDGSLDALFGKGPKLASAFTPEHGYYRELSPRFVLALRDVVMKLAAAQVDAANRYTACEPNDNGPECIGPWLREWGTRIYGQPLTEEQAGAYQAQFRGALASLTPAEAARNVLVSMLLSPYFVLRLELGNNAVLYGLGGYELAARLSHFATRGSPDAKLMASAASGALADPQETLAQYQRLVATAQGHAARELFHLEWFGMETPSNRADLDPELVADMDAQARLLVTEIFAHQDGTFASLLLAAFQPLNDRLATHYGVPIEAGDGFRITNLNAQPFAGMLTTGAFLTRFRSPTRRARQISDALLCSKVPEPPVHPDTPTGMGATARERLASSIGNDPACTSCHALFDPLGLALEAFDDQARLTGADTSGGFVDPPSGNTFAFPVSGPRELGNHIATSATGRKCAVRRYLELALDRRLSDDRSHDPTQGGPNPAQKDGPPPIPRIEEDPDEAWLNCILNLTANDSQLSLTGLAEIIVSSSAFATKSNTRQSVTAFDSSVDPLEHAQRETAQFVGTLQDNNDEQTIQLYLSALRDAQSLLALPGAGGGDAGGANGNDAGAPSLSGAAGAP